MGHETSILYGDEEQPSVTVGPSGFVCGDANAVQNEKNVSLNTDASIGIDRTNVEDEYKWI